ncbi:tetratricopeptide repeat protein [Xanthocytophaga agilis]|uniref:Tetratricopeptide repeat protein n=1 Tax=Xanthocytophaga agilis TaxID=3048010 RepID=A0AAE3R152_9BACT|nr:tetratricopeptide repeat protein [Xanthocytophaga agilis]MDJ1501836.1 tetratricopeptide repeat protein [Xanthocytophaga agilis]
MARIFLLLVIFLSFISCSRKTVESIIDEGFQEDGQKAISLYSKAIKREPQNVEAYWRRGDEYYKIKQYERAIDDFNRAIRIDSAFNAGYLFGDRGLTKHALKDYHGAINDFTIALELCPPAEPSTPREKFYYYRSLSKIRLTDTLAALNDLDSAIYYWNIYPDARLLRARIRMKKGEYNEALQDYQACQCLSSTEEFEEYAVDSFYYGLAKFKTGDSTYCPHWQIALKYKYPGVNDYILKYCKDN